MASMRAVHGKVLISGIPRMTRPRKRKNVGNAAGFSVVDPGGNWIRIFHNTTAADDSAAESISQLAKAMRSAVVLGDSKGDTRQAARILDSSLTKHRGSAPVTDLVEALVYGAELAIRLGDRERAGALLAEVGAVELTGEQRESLREALANAADLEHARTGRD